MTTLYHKFIDHLTKWPGIGSLAASRLLEHFLSDPSLIDSLLKINDLLKKSVNCPKCQIIFDEKSSSCPNCLKKIISHEIFIIPSIIDYFHTQELPSLKNKFFFCLQGYLGSSISKSPSSIGISLLTSILSSSEIKKAYLLFNKTLDARSTQWVLRKNIPSNIELIDLSPALQEKLYLYHLTTSEKEGFLQRMQSLIHFDKCL